MGTVCGRPWSWPSRSGRGHVAAPVPVKIGGQTADFVDDKAAVAHHWPASLAVLVVLTLLALWLMTGSVVLPVQVPVMNGLTAAVATGLLVFVFQDAGSPDRWPTPAKAASS
jgi:uncharacterized membrane protein YdfJ with MMPL/SSD domain